MSKSVSGKSRLTIKDLNEKFESFRKGTEKTLVEQKELIARQAKEIGELKDKLKENNSRTSEPKNRK